jgi:hypothetical protein
MLYRLPKNKGLIVDRDNERVGVICPGFSEPVMWNSYDEEEDRWMNEGEVVLDMPDHLFLVSLEDVWNRMSGNDWSYESMYRMFIMNQDGEIAAFAGGNVYEDGRICPGDNALDGDSALRAHNQFYSRPFNADIRHSVGHLDPHMMEGSEEAEAHFEEQWGEYTAKIPPDLRSDLRRELPDPLHKMYAAADTSVKVLEAKYEELRRKYTLRGRMWRQAARQSASFLTRTSQRHPDTYNDSFPLTRAMKRHLLRNHGISWDAENMMAVHADGSQCTYPLLRELMPRAERLAFKTNPPTVGQRMDWAANRIGEATEKMRRGHEAFQKLDAMASWWRHAWDMGRAYADNLTGHSIRYHRMQWLGIGSPHLLPCQEIMGDAGAADNFLHEHAEDHSVCLRDAYMDGYASILNMKEARKHAALQHLLEGIARKMGTADGMEERVFLDYAKWRPLSYLFKMEGVEAMPPCDFLFFENQDVFVYEDGVLGDKSFTMGWDLPGGERAILVDDELMKIENIDGCWRPLLQESA